MKSYYLLTVLTFLLMQPYAKSVDNESHRGGSRVQGTGHRNDDEPIELRSLSMYDETSAYWQSSASFENGNYLVKWTITNGDFIDLLISITSTTYSPSWIGFGLSEQGSMLGSDVVTVKYDRSTSEAIVSDRWFPWTAYPLTSSPMPYPVLDSQQDWILKSVTATSSTLTAVVSRLLVTTDGQDRPFKNGSLPIIYAWGANPFIAYHGSSRGHSQITFQEDIAATVEPFGIPPDVDGEINIEFSPPWSSLGAPKTSYICQIIDVQSFIPSGERHVVAFESVFDTTPGGAYVHHSHIRGCRADAIQSLLDEGAPLSQPGLCTANTIQLSASCPVILAGTASAKTAFAFPRTAGFRVGTGSDAEDGSTIRYLIAEVHVSNPSLVNNIEISKIIKLYTTSILRVHDAGFMSLGDALLNTPQLPAATAVTATEHSCTSTCSSRFSGPINIFSSHLHAHLTARQLWASVVSYDPTTGASSTTVKDHREFWDFGFQAVTLHNPPWVVQPGDQVNLHCVYDTSKLTGTTRFGLNSWDEMCLLQVMYYPRANAFPYCSNVPLAGQSVCGYIETDIITDVNPKPDGDTVRPRSIPQFGISPFDTSSPSTRTPSKPSRAPTRKPTWSPSRNPSRRPTAKPSPRPSTMPSKNPTRNPTSRSPSRSPTKSPSRSPSRGPTKSPTKSPSLRPSQIPTRVPSSKQPISLPTSRVPSISPSRKPTTRPSLTPTRSLTPSRLPTKFPTAVPA